MHAQPLPANSQAPPSPDSPLHFAPPVRLQSDALGPLPSRLRGRLGPASGSGELRRAGSGATAEHGGSPPRHVRRGPAPEAEEEPPLERRSSRRGRGGERVVFAEEREAPPPRERPPRR